jgi:hypothetical protein
MLAQHRGGPLAAVRRAQQQAAGDEGRFQLARLAALNLSREPPDQRELARSWMRQLRELVPEPSFAAIANMENLHVGS